MVRTISRFLGAALAAFLSMATVEAAGKALPFTLPLPEGWRAETIPFPLDFAPGLPYRGLEELRFAPGMFKAGAPDAWTYGFLWWLDEPASTEPREVARHLEAYYRGLWEAVAPAKGFAGRVTDHRVTLVPAPPGRGEEVRFSGVARTGDAFVTGEALRLHLRAMVWRCPEDLRQVWWFEVSPRPPSDPVWRTFEAIRDGLRCRGPEPKPPMGR